MSNVSHPRFDLQRFAGLFPLADLRGAGREKPFLTPAGHNVTSPFHLAVVELLRREAIGPTVPSTAVPTDVFVFAAGEPPAPFLTKYGGAPFRSRRKPWPTSKDGRALGFVGQLSFMDSADLVGEMPGDVLLVFVDPERPLEHDAYVLEWVALGEADLITEAEIPAATFTARPGRLAQARGSVPETKRFAPFQCHGVIHRTFDLAGAAGLFDGCKEPYRVAVWEATKIGGVPRLVQNVPNIGGHFLGSLASIQPAPEVPFPWVNHEAPLSLAARRALPTWKLGDMGSLYLFERDGRAVAEPQSY